MNTKWLLFIDPFSDTNKSAADDFVNIYVETWKISIKERIIMINQIKLKSLWQKAPFAPIFSKVICNRGVRKRLYEGKG